jgi:hypothetical protein
MTTYVTIQGHTYSDGTSNEGTGVRYLDNGGHWEHFIPLVTDIVATASDVAANIGPVATSVTNLPIGTGSKSFTTQANVANFMVGNWVRITSTANEANYMMGQITSYSSVTLVVNVVDTGGTGTYADWDIRTTGFRGADGAVGATGASTTYTVSVATATASQTVFSKTYTVGYIEVYQNGIRLAPDEFTATNGTSVILGTGATAGDEIMFVVYTVVSMGAALVPADIGATVQAQLVSATNIKTLNGNSLLGSGDLPVKTVSGQSILGSGDVPLFSKAKTLFLAWS